MIANRKRVGLLVLAAGLIGCGGVTTGTTGTAGSTGTIGTGGTNTGTAGTTGTGGTTGTTGACASLGACACMEAGDRCSARTEACWCPSECDPQIVCICGGGRFLACEDRTVVPSCANALAAVQAKCAGQSFVGFIGELCSSAADPTCVAGCLTKLNNTGSCSEIDCGFCTVCDCAGPATLSPFAACLQTCAPPLPN
jgi:hypothetical protein